MAFLRNDYVEWMLIILASTVGGLLGAAVNGILGLLIFAVIFLPVVIFIDRSQRSPDQEPVSR